jgi:hypothetical protein
MRDATDGASDPSITGVPKTTEVSKVHDTNHNYGSVSCLCGLLSMSSLLSSLMFSVSCRVLIVMMSFCYDECHVIIRVAIL